MKVSKSKYDVIVGNVGTMTYENAELAKECYDTYVTLSKSGTTRAGNEPVTLMRDSEIVLEHTPTVNE